MVRRFFMMGYSMSAFVRIVPALVLLAAGCSQNAAHEVHPVAGTVTYDGKPAEGVQVFFMPSKNLKVPGAQANPHAITGPDGRFTLSTFGEGDGAPAGSYRVVLIWPKDREDTEESPADRLFGWFDARHTTLQVNVEAGFNELKPFTIPVISGPPPASEGIPGRN